MNFISALLPLSDINECATETHKCSADAVCRNTKGSHNCTCEVGFDGDGRNCQGEVIVLLSDLMPMLSRCRVNENENKNSIVKEM